MTSNELEGIKALLDVHMEQIRQELRDLKMNYISIHDKVTTISNHTNVALTQITGDLNHIGSRVNMNMDDIKAVKKRVELNEDSQMFKWNEQDKHNQRQDDFQKSLAKKTDKKDALLYGAIGTVIALILKAIFDWVVSAI